MGDCDEGFTYCNLGCCSNITFHCCNIKCNGTDGYCFDEKSDEGSFLGNIVGTLFLIVFAIGVIIFLKSFCKGIKECLCDTCSNTGDCCSDCCGQLPDCDCDCDCDSDKVLKCLSCICLSPCLLVNWLRGEWNERTHENEQYQTTDNRANTSANIPVVTVQPVSPPIQQTNINISIHHGDSRRSLTDDNLSEIVDDYNEGHIPTNSYASGSGRTVDGVILPPSYDEATKNDPPSYQEAHKYPASQC